MTPSYEIKRRVEDNSLGSILIEIAGPQPAGSSGKPMHYSLGHHGRTALRHELERLSHAIA